jgi:hypothetical protein
MKIPNTTKELALAIEALMGSYLDGVRASARQAAERALIRSVGSLSPRGPKKVPIPTEKAAARRTPAELIRVCDALAEMVRAHPGASLGTLAEKMNVEARTLLRPMSKLKSTDRVRRVG